MRKPQLHVFIESDGDVIVVSAVCKKTYLAERRGSDRVELFGQVMADILQAGDLIAGPILVVHDKVAPALTGG
jgi:hypothetical protein